MLLDTHTYFAQNKKQNNQQIVDYEYAIYYINKITTELNQKMRNLFEEEQKKFKIILTNTNVLTNPLRNVNKNLLHTIQEKELINSFKEFKYPFQLFFLDMETDGLDIRTANILQISFIKIQVEEDNKPISIEDVYTTYVKPYDGYQIDENCSSFKVNGIKQQQIDKAPTFKQIAADIADLTVLKVIVGFNIHHFDIPILNRHLKTTNEKSGWTYTIDIAQAFWKSYPLSLTNALKTLGINYNSCLHNAKNDNMACIHIFEHLIKQKQLPQTPKEFLTLCSQDKNTTHRGHIILQNTPTHPWVGQNWIKNYHQFQDELPTPPNSNIPMKRSLNPSTLSRKKPCL